MRYLGPKANKITAYGVASVSGTILAVCSCTILPLFAGIYKMGAGLGPASAFLYSGPAINVLAIVLTARILGPEMGIARAVGAVLLSIIIGAIMKSTEAAVSILAIDGCPLDCAKKSLEEAGFKKVSHLRLSDLGFEKGQTFLTEPNIAKVMEKAKRYL